MNACSISGPHYLILLAAGASLALAAVWVWGRLKNELQPPPANVTPINALRRVCEHRDGDGAA